MEKRMLKIKSEAQKEVELQLEEEKTKNEAIKAQVEQINSDLAAFMDYTLSL